MGRNFYDNDFEEFLRDRSDQYKMYPSDRAWKNINRSLHGKKKRRIGIISFALIGAGLLVGRELLIKNQEAVSAAHNTEATAIQSNQSQPSSTKGTGAAPASNSDNTTARPSSASAPVKSLNNIPVAGSAERISPAPVASLQNTGKPGPAAAYHDDKTSARIIRLASSNSSLLPDASTEQTTRFTGVETDQLISNDIKASIVTPVASHNTTFQVKAPAVKKAKAITQPTTTLPAVTAITREPIQPTRWYLQVYGSPTVSYRRLTTEFASQTRVPVGPNTQNVNQYVRHHPATGFEFGANVQYRISDNLRVFTGAQINYSRYYIEAFKYDKEKASIALDNAPLRDTVSGYTNIRNFSGYAPEQLQNRYLQFSVPVGLEIKLLGHNKLQFSVAGGIQPTFMLTSTSYLLSSNYKNYIQSPDLTRAFNVHTNFEAFISYETSGLRWQIGPQFRSQLLSSYSNHYRVREYLTEYGIKFGVSKTIR